MRQKTGVTGEGATPKKSTTVAVAESEGTEELSEEAALRLPPNPR